MQPGTKPKYPVIHNSRFTSLVRVLLCTLGCLCLAGCELVGSVALNDSLAEEAEARGRYFGSSVVVQALFNQDQPDLAERYRQVLDSQFNLVVPESELKMATVWTGEQSLSFEAVDPLAIWARDHGKKMRGHVLVWHRSLPAWLVAGWQAGTYDSTDVARLVEWYITQVMDHFRLNYPDVVIAWDVVNEAIGPNDPTVSESYGLRPPGWDYAGKGEDFWRLTLGDDYVARCFAWARAADASARLFYNDYHNEYHNPKSTAIMTLVTGLQAAGVPVDGIGLQCHFRVDYLDMTIAGLDFSTAAIAATLGAWADTGLEIQITEADIGMAAGQEAQQAELWADLVELAFSNTSVSAFTTWGFCDLVSWREDEHPLYFDSIINPKPAWYAMVEALKNLP